MNIMGKRAMAITFSMALVMMAFVGFVSVGADPYLPADLTVTVTDNYGDTADMITYVGDDVYFNLTGWGAMNGSADYTVQLVIDEGTGMDMDYDEMYDYFSYTLMDVAAGTHTWNVTVVNNTDMDEMYLAGSLMVYDMPVFTGADFAFDEDMVYMWNLTSFFTGVDSVSIENATELEAEGWTIDDLTMGYYNISQGMDVNGTWEFYVMGTHSYGMTAEGMVMVTINQVNDVPMLVGIEFGDEVLTPEMYNYTWVDETEGNMSEWRNVVNLTGEEDMDMMFMVNASDVEMDDIYYFFEMADMDDPYEQTMALNETNETIPNEFVITPEMDANGDYWATMTIDDDEIATEPFCMFYIQMMFAPMNDAPMIELDGAMMGERMEKLAGEAVNVSAIATDIDDEMDNVTVTWYVNGDMVTMEHDYFMMSWDAEGLYNISVMAEDDDGAMSEEMYFHVNVTIPPPSWTDEDIALNYTEATGDVVKSTATGDIISGLTYGALKSADMAGLDIISIETALDGDNLVITLNLAGTPIESTEIDITDLDNLPTEYETAIYRLYFVKSDFTEPKFDAAAPNMEWEPADFYEVGSGFFSMGYLSYGEILGDEGDPVVSGNAIVWTVSLADLEAAGVTPEDFNLFAQATYSKISTSMEAAYDSAGMNAATHLEPGVGGDDDDSDDDDEPFPIWIIIVIVIILLVIIVIIIIVMKKGKKEEEEIPEEPMMGDEEMPVEGGEMPMEGMEQPMEQPMPEEPVEQPMEQTYEQPVAEEPVPEQPVAEEPVPEQPVAEEPVPPQPEVPAPEAPVAPPEPQPPVPPQ